MSAYPHGNFFLPSSHSGGYSDTLSVIVQTNDKGPSFSTFKKCGEVVVVQREEGKTGREAAPSTKRRLPGWTWGSPRCSPSWCSALENQTVETFPCHVSYCLLHLGQGFSFHPMLAVTLPLRLGGLQEETETAVHSLQRPAPSPAFGKHPHFCRVLEDDT